MRLIQLHWAANPNVAEKPVYLNADLVAAVLAVDTDKTMVMLQNSAPVMVPIPAAVIVEQLYEGYGATKH